MIYVQFFEPKRKAVYLDGAYTGAFDLVPNEYQEALGDRAVIILDGRESKNTMLAYSASEMTKRGYKAFQLFSGDSFTRSSAVSTLFTD